MGIAGVERKEEEEEEEDGLSLSVMNGGRTRRQWFSLPSEFSPSPPVYI